MVILVILDEGLRFLCWGFGPESEYQSREDRFNWVPLRYLNFATSLNDISFYF